MKKHFILDVWQDSEYASRSLKLFHHTFKGHTQEC